MLQQADLRKRIADLRAELLATMKHSQLPDISDGYLRAKITEKLVVTNPDAIETIIPEAVTTKIEKTVNTRLLRTALNSDRRDALIPHVRVEEMVEVSEDDRKSAKALRHTTPEE